MSDALEALTLPDDVATIIDDLNEWAPQELEVTREGSKLLSRAADVLERQAREIATLQAQVEELEAEKDKLVGLNADWESRCKAFHHETGG